MSMIYDTSEKVQEGKRQQSTHAPGRHEALEVAPGEITGPCLSPRCHEARKSTAKQQNACGLRVKSARSTTPQNIHQATTARGTKPAVVESKSKPSWQLGARLGMLGLLTSNDSCIGPGCIATCRPWGVPLLFATSCLPSVGCRASRLQGCAGAGGGPICVWRPWALAPFCAAATA